MSDDDRPVITEVKALACAPLTGAAVAELLSLAAAPPVDDDDFADIVRAERGWALTDLVCDAAVTAHRHVLYSDGNPLGDATVPAHLVFGELYPFLEECRDDEKWLTGLVGEWAEQPGWGLVADPSVRRCEQLLTEAAATVEERLGAPLRVVLDDGRASLGPDLPFRIWRHGAQAVLLGAVSDNGPYGYLTQLVLSTAPWPEDAALPDDEDGVRQWVLGRVDW